MVRRAARLAAMMIIAVMVTGCALLPTGRSRAPAREEPTPTPIPTPVVPTKPTYRVQRGEVIKKLTFTGRIAPVLEKELYFRTSGRVRHVYVQRNDFVKAGQILADLEIDDLERELTAAQLELERAQVRLEAAERELQNAIRRAEINLEIAKLNLEIAKAHDPTPRKAQAQADLERAQVELQRAQEEYNAIAWRNDRAATKQAAALQQATLNYQKAKATYDLIMQDIAAYQYEIAIKERQVELAQLALDELNRGVDPLLKNDVERALLKVQKLEAAIADAQIIAPFDGQVLSITLTEGRPVDAFKPVVVVADPSELEVSADLTSTQLQDLAEGMPATVVLVSRPGEELKGYIRRLPYPYGGGGRTGTFDEEDKSTRIALEASAAEAGYEMGDLARVTVVLERKEDVLWLPPQAVRIFEGRTFVVVKEGEAQRRVDVKVGIKGEDRWEIEEGLTEGQIVIGQ
ncbi:MAG TPA: HlyD family efflux transporter periplasmic adaptor subunit [Caldilineae bacterium]|nr:HlyD family efflux transporter periplasmic adaptor subunit [Caldilineae bacterium]